ncbi:MAG: ABC transporter ATP-binding protein [Candidatus Microbacterium phytovorans]|uniref:ABC transporter ATP-binding protein n=1 Tax=Candidatus Microbacterium phytovorans TaxID=3121374 RepID=A0AAJ5W2H1_9MICO|nr:ABC transporter ATP-binding protein [Microbacterium sp.]WEK13322.1 MAG: ABC transporter ATP-binding protein [Microbacterium sp.]
MSAVLDVRDLAVAYESRRGRVVAVDGIDIRIEPGEAVALVGETGSGKTTAALASIGLLPRGAVRLRGTVALGGQDITGWSPRRLERILGREVGLVPQDPTASLDPLKTVGWQIGEVFRIHGERDRARISREVEGLLERVGLAETGRIARSFPHELSGGQRQRVLIAGAIALRPGLIVADESTSALDVTVQRTVLDLLDDLRREDGSGLLFVTHDLAVAAERADRIIVLEGGIVQDAGDVRTVLGAAVFGDTAAPDEAVAPPVAAYTRRLVANAPALQPARFRDPAPRRSADGAGGPAIEVADLRKVIPGHRGRSDVHALDGVSFTVPPATTHAIVGESGSGKSTVARIALGLTAPTSGAVRVAGTDLVGPDGRGLTGTALRAFRRRVQLVYQSPYASLNPSMRILDTVAEPLRRFEGLSRAAARREAADLLDRVALGAELHDRRPRELSGGQRQRVAIARALAPKPDVLVLDEPVSALDVTVQAQILRLLDELQRERALTYLFISHDLAVVRQIADTVTVLSRGRVEETGSTRDVFERPRSDYTVALLDAIPAPAFAVTSPSRPHRGTP